MSDRPPVTRMTHPLPFERLSPADFERLCLWLVRREGYEDAEHLGAAGGEQGRDIVAWRDGRRVVFQCKRVDRLDPSGAEKEIDKLRSLPSEDQPDDVVFVVSTAVSVTARDRARAAWGDQGSCGFWAGTELDERVKRYADILHEFFSESIGTEPGAAEEDGRHDFYRHVSMPAHYVERPSLHQRLVEAVIASNTEVTLAALPSTSLHGMGGIGKTVTARALCDDPKVQATFADGILWTSLGSKPDIRRQTAELIEALGGTVAGTTSNALKAQLARLLAGRACLLVLDDVWNGADVEAFRVLGPRGRLLITTRDETVAGPGAGASVERVPLMSISEAIDSLERWAGGALDDEPQERKCEIVERCGRLPLAVRLAGARLRRVDSTSFLASFSLDSLALGPSAGLEPGGLRSILRISYDSLPEWIRPLYASLGIFPEGEPVSRVRIRALWSTLGGVPEGKTEQALEEAEARALIDTTMTKDGEAVVLHDLLRDFLKEELDGEAEIAANEALLSSYSDDPGKQRWHELENDGYLYSHLAVHLLAAKREVEFSRLFASDGWLRARLADDDYDYSGYLTDVGVAANRAKEVARDSVEGVAQSFRYALISTTCRSMLLNYAPALVRQALRAGIWSARRAINIAHQETYHRDSVFLYAAILETDLPEDAVKVEVKEAALARFPRFSEHSPEAEALLRLWPLIPFEDRERLAARLPRLITTEVNKLRQQPEDVYPGLLKDLCRRASECDDILDEELQLSIVEAITSESVGRDGRRELEAATPFLSRKHRKTLLAYALEPGQLSWRWGLLGPLAASLETCDIGNLVDRVLGLHEGLPRLKSLVALAGRLVDGDQRAMADLCVEEARRFDLGEAYLSVATLMQNVGAETVKDVLSCVADCVRTEHDSWRAWDVLSAYLQWTPQDERPYLLEIVQAFARSILLGEGVTDWYSLRGLVAYFDDSQRREALETSFGLVSFLQIEAMEELGPYLDPTDLRRAFARMSCVEDPSAFALALTCIAERVGGVEGRAWSQKAADKLLTAPSSLRSDEAVLAMCQEPCFAKVEGAIELATKLHGSDQVDAMVAIAEHSDELGQIEVLRIFDRKDRCAAEALAALVTCLRGRSLSAALSRADDLAPRSRGRVLLSTPRTMITDQRQRALEELREELAKMTVADVTYGELENLCHLTPLLPDDVSALVVAATSQVLIGERDVPYMRLGVAALMKELAAERVMPVVEAAVEAAYPGGRGRVSWGGIAGEEPVASFGTIARLAHGVIKERVLEAVLDIEDHEAFGQALALLAPQLNIDESERVLKVGLKGNVERLCEVLYATGPYLGRRATREALDASQQIRDTKARNWALSSILRRLVGSEFRILASGWLDSSSIEERGHLLWRCASGLLRNKELTRPTLLSMGEALIDVCERWDWT